MSKSLDKNLLFCPVGITFTDHNAEVRTRLLKKRWVWLFGRRCPIQIPPVRPAFAQCDKCQVLGHTSKGCKAQPRCARCAGKHTTKNHRACCAQCAQAALPADQECPHPPHCANCNGVHQATAEHCKMRRKYRNPPLLPTAADSELDEMEEEL